jgi:hypothetical protein
MISEGWTAVLLGATLLFNKTIPKVMITVLLIAITAMLLFDVTARTNEAGRNLLKQSVLMEENAYVSLLCVSGDSGKILVDPKDNVYYSWEKRMNDTIVINVTVANMAGLCGLSFKLYFNGSLLMCTGFIENLFHTVTPQSAWSNIWQIKRAINNVAGYIEYVYTYMDLSQALHGGYAPINITESEYPEGKLTAAILTFSITKMPPPNAYVDCPFHLTSIQPTDAQGNVILYDVVDGYYRLISPTGDINGNNIIDIYDGILFSNAFGSVPASPYWNSKADLNSDDIVDIFDAIVLATNFGKPTS